MEKKRKILVIGSEGHSLAKCASWSKKIPYLGDYDLVIINLGTLSPVILESIGEELLAMREDLNDAIWRDTEVICITAPTFSTSGTEISNYSWCPIWMNFVEKNGKEFSKGKSLDAYLSHVKQWSHFWKNYYPGEYKTVQRTNFDVRLRPILKNKAGKVLAINLQITEKNGAYDPIHSKIIQFLPPPTTCSVKEGIGILISRDSESECTLPAWTDAVNLHNEEQIKKTISGNQEEISELEKEIIKNEGLIKNLSKFKQLLTEGDEGESGDRLEIIVRESLELLGITAKEGAPGEEDLNIIDPKTGEKNPVEIGGMKKSIPESKLAQLLKWITARERPKKIKTRGILIGNPYREVALDNKLEGRNKPVEESVVKKAEVFEVSILPTIEIFKAVRAKMQKENVSNFINRIFNSLGLIEFEEKVN
ncbi:MAG: hypothetical protein ABIH35_03400, partial [Patescibacteria group bacterium]